MQTAAETGLIGRPLPKTPALLSIARRLIWWMAPEEGLEERSLFLARVMTLGTWDDVMSVRAELGESVLRVTLSQPPPGIFDLQSWRYWHRVFGLDSVPPLPKRRL